MLGDAGYKVAGEVELAPSCQECRLRGPFASVHRHVDCPQLEKVPDIRPRQLLQILKGAYGLTEVPWLWYLQALERLTGPVVFQS